MRLSSIKRLGEWREETQVRYRAAAAQHLRLRVRIWVDGHITLCCHWVVGINPHLLFGFRGCCVGSKDGRGCTVPVCLPADADAGGGGKS